MHPRRSVPISSLSLVLPHPPLPRRTSAVRPSQVGDAEPSPRTPRSSCGISSPSLFKLESGAPRKSTDSWNSSNYDAADDEMEWEWTSDQLALLNKTLDALPSHLLTPFNGAIPPPNVLDKISRSIIHAKDPLEWPHSVRSTRVKLLNLARSRGQDDRVQDRPRISDHPLNDGVLQSTNNVPKKPLYRQSSMDFLKGNSLNHEKSIDRLSTRLQRVDRTMMNPAGNPYARSPDSPLAGGSRPFSLGDDPYTPTTPTDDLHHRNSASSLCMSRGPRLRRSTTTISNLPTIPWGVTSNIMSGDTASLLAVPTVKRSGSFTSPSKNGLGHSLKRAPSFGTLSTRSSSSRMSIDDQKENSPAHGLAKHQQQLDIYPSSDDEEKVRGKKVKKQRITSSAVSNKANSSLSKVTSSSTLKSTGTATPKGSVRSRKTSKVRLTRSSSMFGAELPNPQPNPVPAPMHSPAISPPSSVVMSPLVSPQKTLRRVKTTNFPRAALPRRISFSNLATAVEEEVEHSGSGLGDAFQLH